MKKLLALALFLAAFNAYAATAMLVSQRTGSSVTGQWINICTYSYGGSFFDRYYPMGQFCPFSVEVQ